MRRHFQAAILTAATLLIATGATNAFNQSKKPTSKGGTIELVQSRDGKYRFNVRDAEGKYLGGSTVGHATEKEAREAVEEMKRVLATASYVSKKSEGSKDDKGKDK
jgi:hypothetical protein